MLRLTTVIGIIHKSLWMLVGKVVFEQQCK